jgi:diaminohydroxyphosphoribosylaminopyrimidine deaminase/5-amino-6-(5-phosphoribosylamino)uracil reductase
MTSVDYLHSANLLAKKANSLNIRPNPFVGAIVVDKNGQIIGKGYHQKAGEAHAEVNAINDALLQNKDLSSCTLYVTLEPCSHTGKTPPCTNLIIEHKIQKVVIGSMDPNTLVSGAKTLTDAGVEVEVCILPEIVELNSTFNINQINKRPKYILKSATTINGKVADRLGNSKWISNEQSRNYVHEILRSNADAILTTAHTIIKDNATMNIRIANTEPKELNLIVIDKDLAILNEENKGLSLFYERKFTKIYLLTDKEYTTTLPQQIEIIKTNFSAGIINMAELSQDFLRKNICEILVEAGGKLNASLIKQQLIDEIVLLLCPSLLSDNEAINILNDSSFQPIENKYSLKLIETKQLDNDLMIKYKVLY